MLLFCSKTCCEICIIRVIRDSDTNFATRNFRTITNLLIIALLTAGC